MSDHKHVSRSIERISRIVCAILRTSSLDFEGDLLSLSIKDRKIPISRHKAMLALIAATPAVLLAS